MAISQNERLLLCRDAVLPRPVGAPFHRHGAGSG
jgi:hypothetical protein